MAGSLLSASSSSSSSSNFYFIFFLAVIASVFPIQEAKLTKLVLYAHETRSGPVPTAANVAGKKGTNSITTEFGTVVVFDDPVTDGPSLDDSKIVGRFQGTVMNAELNGQRLSGVYNILFTDGEFKGSSLQFQGTQSLSLDQSDEVGVVSGTGHFRFVKGYASLEFTSLDLEKLRGSFKLDITLKHDSIHDANACDDDVIF